MTTTNKLRKLLHRKAWEFCTPSPNNTTAGSFIEGDKYGVFPDKDCVYYVAGASSIYNYSLSEDAWLQLSATTGVAGSFGAGSCGEFIALGMLGGAVSSLAFSNGTNTTINTDKAIVRSLAGCKVRVVAGTGIGYEQPILSNTIGTNSVLTFATPNGAPFDTTTRYQIYSGSLWFWNAGTASTPAVFSVYDRATNAWAGKSVTGVPTAWGTSGNLISTNNPTTNFDTGTASAVGTAVATLTCGSKAWATNAWANFTVRITAGTGIGQIRQIVSNTATVLTVASTWTTGTDSVFVIEGDEDKLYLMGNNVVTMYRYSISANAWTTLSPTTARGSGGGGGLTGDWIDHVVSDTDWEGAKGKLIGTPTAGTAQVKQNGRYIYSFAGGGTTTLHSYDIAANTWASYGVPLYGNAGNETFNTGSCSVDADGFIYIQKEASGRIFRFDVAKHTLEPFATNVYPQSTTVAEGDKMFIGKFTDGATEIKFLYTLQHNRNEALRMLII